MLGGGGPQRPSCCPLVPRVDGKDVSYESRLEHKRDLCDFQRVSPDAKDPRLCRPPRNGIVGHLRGCQDPPEKVGTPPPKSPPLTSLHPSQLPGGSPSLFSPQVPDVGLRDELPSDESLSESGTAQHFAGKLPSPGGIPWVFLGLLLIPHTFLCPHSVRLPDADPGQRHRDLPTPGLWRGPHEEHPKTPRAPGAAARCGAGEAGSPHQSAPESSDPGTGGAQRGGAAGARQTPRHRGPLPRRRPPRRSQPPGLSPRCVSQRVTRGRGGRVRPPPMLQGAHRCSGEGLIIWGGGGFVGIDPPPVSFRRRR